jgi:hypothetical protein
MTAELVELSIPIRAPSPSKDHIVVVVDDSVRSLLVARCLFPHTHYTCATLKNRRQPSSSPFLLFSDQPTFSQQTTVFLHVHHGHYYTLTICCLGWLLIYPAAALRIRGLRTYLVRGSGPRLDRNYRRVGGDVSSRR